MASPHEHHSNLLPWRNLEGGGIDVRVINLEENPLTGQIDLECLERELKEASSKGGIIIGCFAAASNVTGVMNDDLAGNF